MYSDTALALANEALQFGLPPSGARGSGGGIDSPRGTHGDTKRTSLGPPRRLRPPPLPTALLASMAQLHNLACVPPAAACALHRAGIAARAAADAATKHSASTDVRANEKSRRAVLAVAAGKAGTEHGFQVPPYLDNPLAWALRGEGVPTPIAQGAIAGLPSSDGTVATVASPRAAIVAGDAVQVGAASATGTLRRTGAPRGLRLFQRPPHAAPPPPPRAVALSVTATTAAGDGDASAASRASLRFSANGRVFGAAAPLRQSLQPAPPLSARAPGQPSATSAPQPSPPTTARRPPFRVHHAVAHPPCALAPLPPRPLGQAPVLESDDGKGGASNAGGAAGRLLVLEWDAEPAAAGGSARRPRLTPGTVGDGYVATATRAAGDVNAATLGSSQSQAQGGTIRPPWGATSAVAAAVTHAAAKSATQQQRPVGAASEASEMPIAAMRVFAFDAFL